jgi:hypothetical protein
MIPKPNGGGERALGIPTIRDRVIQTAAKLVLEPIFEADFEDNAYGYRPARGRSAEFGQCAGRHCRGSPTRVTSASRYHVGVIELLNFECNEPRCAVE